MKGSAHLKLMLPRRCFSWEHGFFFIGKADKGVGRIDLITTAIERPPDGLGNLCTCRRKNL